MVRATHVPCLQPKQIAKIGTAQFDDFNAFDDVLKTALKDASVKLETKEKSGS